MPSSVTIEILVPQRDWRLSRGHMKDTSSLYVIVVTLGLSSRANRFGKDASYVSSP